MRIARILDWKGERLIQTRLYHGPRRQPPFLMDGKATAEASITLQRLPDSPKTGGVPCGIRRTSANGTSNATIRCLSL